MPDTLRGTIEHITFHNEENGYTVAQLQPDGAAYTVAVIGAMLGINVGESVEMRGAWTSHPQYGRQFKADTVKTVLPATIAGLEKYLGSGLIKGVGPVTAKRIVRKFGLDTLRVIEETPARLREVLGVGAKRVAIITRAWAEQQKIKEVMLFLQSHNVSTGLAVKIYKRYGDDAISVVESDPYRLARDIYGIGFITADKIARELGIAADAPERVAAGVAYVLSQAADEGNVYLPSAELTDRSAELLGVKPNLVQDGIVALREAEQVWVEGGDVPGTSQAPGTLALAEERPVYLIPFYRGEIGVANRLRRLAEAANDRLPSFHSFDWPAAFAALQAQTRLPLTPRQQDAVQAALTHRVTVLTGGPGTGKCIAGDTLIRTEDGLQVISALMPPEMPPVADTFVSVMIPVLTRDGPQSASMFYYGGLCDTVRLTTQEGYSIEGTLNHRLIAATVEGPAWRRLDELKEGDFVAIYREEPRYDFQFDPFAYFLGLFTGDGGRNMAKSGRMTSVCITTGDSEIADFIEVMLPKLGLSWSKIPNDPDCHAYRYTIGGSRGNKTGGVVPSMRAWGETFGTSRTKTVPNKILAGSLSQRRSYLQGLFDTDGTAAKRDGYVELGLSNEHMLRSVQIMLLQFGIISTLRAKPQTDSWRLTITGPNARLFYERIGFRVARKQARRYELPESSNPNLDLVPCLDRGLLRRYIGQTGHHDRRWWWQWKRECKGDRLPSRQRVLNLLDQYHTTTAEESIIYALCHSSIYWAKIGKLERRQTTVYDLSVPNAEEFIGNGFINHNTTTVRTIIRLAEAAGAKTVLASPTGRAAKRLSEAAGRPAKTIHRLLEVKPAEGFAFTRNEENPLEADLVIVDEASMLDLLLTNHLLKAIPPGAHLLLVGDIDQLPSVGAGNVLQDVIEAVEGSRGAEEQGSRGEREQGSGSIPLRPSPPVPQPPSSPAPLHNAAVVRLDTIFRQPEGSYIITNAHRINRGQMPALDNRNARDFFLFKEEDPEKAAVLIAELVQERIPRKFGLSSDDIQVLSPMHRGEAGVSSLNTRLQAALNPPEPGKAERAVGGRVFREGDRVMQIRNNYDKDVFNGDMGRIAAIDLEEQTVAVRMDDRSVSYDFLELDELVHAYAVSIHKSQGSEFPAVVVPLLASHYMMLQRNLLYTAVTRAKRLVVLVGAERAIAIAVRNDKAKERYSGLAERLGG